MRIHKQRRKKMPLLPLPRPAAPDIISLFPTPSMRAHHFKIFPNLYGDNDPFLPLLYIFAASPPSGGGVIFCPTKRCVFVVFLLAKNNDELANIPFISGACDFFGVLICFLGFFLRRRWAVKICIRGGWGGMFNIAVFRSLAVSCSKLNCLRPASPPLTRLFYGAV